MKPEHDRNDSKQPPPQAARRRFRLQKLEDRIAPKKGGNKATNGCAYDSQGTGTSGY